MTNADYTAIACLMDRSGSMSAVRKDAEGAFNTFLDEQKKLPGKYTIRLSEFDDKYDTVYASRPIAEAPAYHLTPRGWTALLDGIGRLVTEFGEELAALPEDERPGKVLVVVQTDGEENASHEWTKDRVFHLIRRQERDYGWTFVYLGANQDAIKVGAGLGFAAASTMSFNSTRAGTRAAGVAVSNYSTTLRGAPAGQSVSFTDEDREAAMADD